MGIFSDNAVRIWELGFNPIPCIGKRPQGGNQQRWGAERMSLEYLEEFLVPQYAQCGIGIILGTYGIAIDVDFEDEDFLKLLPPTPMVRRGEKGVAAIYQNSKELATDTTGGVSLELRSTGLFLVLPPSYHPITGEPYIWLPGSKETALKELPVLQPEIYGALKKEALLRGHTKKIRRTNADGDTVEIEGGGRNTALFHAAAAWGHNEFANGIANADDGIRFLLNLDKKRHGVDAWFWDDAEHAGPRKTPEQRAASMIERVINGLKPKNRPRVHISVGDDIAGEPGVVQQPGAKSDLVDQPKLTDWNALAPRGGLLDLIMRYTTTYAGFEIPQLWLGSAISLLSFAAGNRLRLSSVWPNTYSFLMAKSGVGKTRAKDAHLAIILAAGCKGALIGKGKFASSAAFTDGFDPTSRKRHNIMDEITGLLKQMANPGGRENHMNGGTEVLCDLFSAGHSRYLGKAARNEESKDDVIVNPCLSIMALGTTAGFEDALSEELVQKGFIARGLWFIDQRSDEEIAAGINNFDMFSNASFQDPPQELIQALSPYFSDPYEQKPDQPAWEGNGFVLDVEDLICGASQQAKLNEIAKDGMRLGLKYGEERPEWAPSYARRGELIAKLCIVAAMDRCTRMVTDDMIDWALNVWEAQFGNLKGLLAKAAFQSTIESKSTDLVDALGKKRCPPMDLRDFNRKFKRPFEHKHKQFAYKLWVEEMVNDGRIFIEKIEGSSGRAKQLVYFLST